MATAIDKIKLAKAASSSLGLANTNTKNQVLANIAALLPERTDAIIAANAIDIERGVAEGLSTGLQDRLRLDAARIQSLADAVELVIGLPDPIGDVVRGRVARMTNFGAFVELAEGIEGLCHVSELDDKHVEKPTEFLNAGQEVEMRIIKLNLQEKKIGLSLKAMKEDEPRLEFTPYKATADAGSASMGERLGAQLQRLKRAESEAETPESDDE